MWQGRKKAGLGIHTVFRYQPPPSSPKRRTIVISMFAAKFFRKNRRPALRQIREESRLPSYGNQFRWIQRSRRVSLKK